MATPGWRDFNATQVGTGSGATATRAGATGVLNKVTHISGHTDADAFITIRDGDGDAAVLWEVWLDQSVNGNAFAINIPNGIFGTSGNAISGKVSASSADCQVNISGESLP